MPTSATKSKPKARTAKGATKGSAKTASAKGATKGAAKAKAKQTKKTTGR